MNAQSQNYTVDVNEFGQAPPSFEESQRWHHQNDAVAPAPQHFEQQQTQQAQQGRFVETTEPPEHAPPAPQQHPPNNNANAPVNGIPPDQVQYVTPLDNLPNVPQWIDCPYCKQRTQTRIVQENSSSTILFGVILGCLFPPLACLPCICGFAQETDHWCTQCNNRLTHRPQNGPVEVLMPKGPGQPGGQQVSAYALQGQPQMQYQPQGVQQQGSFIPPNYPHQAMQVIPGQSQAQSGNQQPQQPPRQAST